MSILGQASSGEVSFALALLLLTVAGTVAATWLGLFRRDAVAGPDRAAGPNGGWPVLVTLLLGTSAWLGTQMALATYKQAQWTKAGHEGHFQISNLTPADYAFLSTVPGVVAIATILATLSFFPRDQRPRLGANPSFLPNGVASGLLAILLSLPLVLLVSAATEIIYQAVGFQHPSEHDLLRAMRDPNHPGTRALLVVGAVLVAPVMEETLFRGLFQTLLVWAFNHRLRPKSTSDSSFILHPSSFSSSRLVVGRWLAILVTAVVFAGIHDKWSVPPIFVLALCLGFWYERTGNLWTTITLHALFNGFQTAYFLTHFSTELPK